MFRVTPVNENRERKVSFSPDIDESYRHQVVDKIKGLMDEVQVIHSREEKHLKKVQEQERFDFKQKQELELQAFLKKQKESANSFESEQSSRWNDLKERHTQETWRLFGRPGQGRGGVESRGSIAGLWANQDPRTATATPPSSGEKGARSQQQSSFSPQHPASPVGPHSNGWISTTTSATGWNGSQSFQGVNGASNSSWSSSQGDNNSSQSNPPWNSSTVSNNEFSRSRTSPNNYWNPNS